MTNRELIFYGGLLISFIYIIFMIVMQIIKSNERKKIINNAKRKYIKADNDFLKTKNKLLEIVAKIYGQDQADKVKKGTIWIGMPITLLIIALGRPNNRKENIYKNKTTEKWYYGEYLTRFGNYKYKFEVILENDKVAGWKDLA